MRYVSHKIRSSPLNVARAGLELLKTDLEAARASGHIFGKQYGHRDPERHAHIDSGTFKLEMPVTPLLNVFAGRLKAYKYMTLLEEEHHSSHRRSGASIGLL